MPVPILIGKDINYKKIRLFGEWVRRAAYAEVENGNVMAVITCMAWSRIASAYFGIKVIPQINAIPRIGHTYL